MFWDSQVYKQLMRRWGTPTVFDLLGLAHNERVFTRMIYTALNIDIVGKGFADRVLVGIVNHIIEKRQGREGDDLKNMQTDLTREGSSIVSIQVEMERPIEVFQDGKRYTGYIDLLVDFEIKSLEGTQKYRIVMENKVGSQEHKLGQHEDGPWQTVGYKNWGAQYVDVRTAYVFLAPYDEVVCHSPDYFRLNYQDVACILTGSLVEIENENLRMLFESFINTLGPTLLENERMVVVMNDEEKSELEKFWEEEGNRDQIMYLVEMMLKHDIEMDKTDKEKSQAAVARNQTALVFRVGEEEVDEETFKGEFTKVGRANRVLLFADGHEEQKPWVLRNLGENANIRGNVQSQNWWRNRQRTGLISVVCQIEQAGNAAK